MCYSLVDFISVNVLLRMKKQWKFTPEKKEICFLLFNNDFWLSSDAFWPEILQKMIKFETRKVDLWKRKWMNYHLFALVRWKTKSENIEKSFLQTTFISFNVKFFLFLFPHACLSSFNYFICCANFRMFENENANHPRERKKSVKLMPLLKMYCISMTWCF